MNHGPDITSKFRHYVEEEPDATFRQQVIDLWNKSSDQASQELSDRLMHGLKFGTAGLRGRMEAGYNRMNLTTVFRFCYALGMEILDNYSGRRVVIGFDGRLHSENFAKEAYHVLHIMGLDVLIFNSYVPTPLCAFATKNCNAVFGVMITASHNPHYDNGIKLYTATSAQAFGPVLNRLETNMEKAQARHEFYKEHQSVLLNGSLKKIPDSLLNEYLKALRQTRLFSTDLRPGVPVIYTPLHGVGKDVFFAGLQDEGFNKVDVVVEQVKPDSAFPTVFFPNPEENHTLDLAHRLAAKKNIPWVFAHDPDADRLQVSAINSAGSFQKLSGNEMGAIFAYFAILRAKALKIKPLLASSIVSSRMVKAMCQKMDALYVDGLTGFSNIVAKAMSLQKESGHQFVFAYEEAIGFLIGNAVLDKDGINAGLRFMEIASTLAQSSITVWEFLDQLYVKFGLFVNAQWSERFDGLSAMQAKKSVMDRIRALPVSTIAEILNQTTITKFDLREKQINNSYEGLQADVVIFEAERVRMIIRPSGTEPKIKFYLETFEHATDQKTISMTRSGLNQEIAIFQSNIKKTLGGQE
jgi:phosphomannomutase